MREGENDMYLCATNKGLKLIYKPYPDLIRNGSPKNHNITDDMNRVHNDNVEKKV